MSQPIARTLEHAGVTIYPNNENLTIIANPLAIAKLV